MVKKLRFIPQRSITTTPRRNNFTLLEMMVCLTILGIVASAISWNVKGLIDRSRLQHAEGKFRAKLQELKILTLTHDAEIELTLFQKGSNIYYTTKTDEPIKPFIRSEQLLAEHCALSFNHKPEKSCRLTIHSDGRVEPKGVLEIQPKGGKRETKKFCF